MTEGTGSGRFQPPSGKSIVIGSVAAVVAAAIALLVFILPAEYGIDPTGIGRALGIEGMSAGQTRTIELTDTIGGNETLSEIQIPAFGDPVPLPNPAVFQLREGAPRTQTMTVELESGAETEVKTVLTENQAIVYEWTVDGGIVYSQFHGHTPEFGDDFWVEYREIEQGAASESGSLVAPFSGEHGWYFVNLSTGPVTITVTVTGYFDDMIDYSALF